MIQNKSFDQISEETSGENRKKHNNVRKVLISTLQN
jgi:hypothetical protein